MGWLMVLTVHFYIHRTGRSSRHRVVQPWAGAAAYGPIAGVPPPYLLLFKTLGYRIMVISRAEYEVFSLPKRIVFIKARDPIWKPRETQNFPDFTPMPRFGPVYVRAVLRGRDIFH